MDAFVEEFDVFITFDLCDYQKFPKMQVDEGLYCVVEIPHLSRNGSSSGNFAEEASGE